MMQRDSDHGSEDCGVRLVPIAVSKSRGVEYKLRKDIDFLSNLRKEYEVNMLEVKKELLDEKIHKREVEEQRKEFLEAVTKGRIQWQQEKSNLEKELKEAKEKVSELTSKLNLKEVIMKEMNSRARSPSVMPKEERVAVVDAMMEVVGVRNEIAAQALFMKRLSEQNGELKKTISDLEEENKDMKQEIEKLRLQVISNAQGHNEEPMEEVRDFTTAKQKYEERRGELQDRTSKEEREEQRGSKVRDVISKRQRREKRRDRVKDATSQKQERKETKAKVKDAKSKKQGMDGSGDAARLKALTRARDNIEQARDLSEIQGAVNLSTSEKVASLRKKLATLGMKGYPQCSGTSSDKENSRKMLMEYKGLSQTFLGKKMVVAAAFQQKESIRRVYYR